MEPVIWRCVCGHAEREHDTIEGPYGPREYGACLHDRCKCAKSKVSLFGII
jgi:hypothetical protein